MRGVEASLPDDRGPDDAGGGDRLRRFRRPPERVMRLERLGASYPTRLSFMRSLLREGARRVDVVVFARVVNETRPPI